MPREMGEWSAYRVVQRQVENVEKKKKDMYHS